MKKLFFAAIAAVALTVGFTACSDRKDVDGTVEDKWEVTAVLTPTGLGDLGYNDQMYLGLCYIREELGCDVVERRPSSVAEGRQMAGEWIRQTPEKGKHRLLILCDETYRAAVSEQGWKNTDESIILQLECMDDDPDIYTRCMPLYGACRVVGEMCKETVAGTDKQVALVMANPYDLSITEGKDGFLEGAGKAGLEVTVHYMANEAGMGYDRAEDLYHLCYELASTTGFVLPLAGGTNKGVYQYGREAHTDYIWTCAFDSDLAYTSYSAAYGVMKYIDQLLLDFARRWKNGLPNEQHAICGLASGYVKVEVNPYIQNPWGANMEEYLKEATACENERYK